MNVAGGMALFEQVIRLIDSVCLHPELSITRLCTYAFPSTIFSPEYYRHCRFPQPG
jgi:hypothetical protein